MTHARLYVLVLSAFFAGVGLVLACSDDSPGNADAASSCDCSGYEPTIDSSRLYTRRTVAAPPANAGSIGQPAWGGTSCDDGDILLGGGCWVFELGAPTSGTDPAAVVASGAPSEASARARSTAARLAQSGQKQASWGDIAAGARNSRLSPAG